MKLLSVADCAAMLLHEDEAFLLNHRVGALGKDESDIHVEVERAINFDSNASENL